jgi:metal-responsive CopG/Arc/MetJ family transcriptional regulator
LANHKKPEAKKAKVIAFSLPVNVLILMEQIVDPNKRSRFITAAITEKIQRDSAPLAEHDLHG